MKLNQAVICGLSESHFFFTICEEGEGPKWNFNYDNWQNDPTPSVLILGAYRHPNTGNNLIGGINLNYLNKADRDSLARILPQLMKATNLYQRYHLGVKLLPNVFEYHYRTYDAKHIRGVTPDVFLPKYGMLQATQNFIKKKITGIFKSKAKRAQDAEPKFPQDLANMKDTLDQAVNQLGLQIGKVGKGPAAQPETPEMQAARQNFMKFKLDRARSLMDIERQEDEPFIQANNQFQATQLQQGQATPQQVSPQVAAQAQTQLPPTQQQPQATPQQMGDIITRERAQHQQELLDPKNSLDLDGDGLPDDQQPVKESLIYYYDQNLKQYVVEDIDAIISI